MIVLKDGIMDTFNCLFFNKIPELLYGSGSMLLFSSTYFAQTYSLNELFLLSTLKYG